MPANDEELRSLLRISEEMTRSIGRLIEEPEPPNPLPIQWSHTFDDEVIVNRARADNIRATTAQGDPLLVELLAGPGNYNIQTGDLFWVPDEAREFRFRFAAYLGMSRSTPIGTLEVSVTAVDEQVPPPHPNGDGLLPTPTGAVQTISDGELTDRGIWQGGRLPDEETDYVIRHNVTNPFNESFRGRHGIIRPDGFLDCLAASRLHSYGSLNVEGKLHMGDAWLRFYVETNATFVGNVGSGRPRPAVPDHPRLDDYVASDIGLWTFDHAERKCIASFVDPWVQCVPFGDPWKIPPKDTPGVGNFHFDRKIERTPDIKDGNATMLHQPVGWNAGDSILVALCEFKWEERDQNGDGTFPYGADFRYRRTTIKELNGHAITLNPYYDRESGTMKEVNAWSKRRDDCEINTFLVNMSTRGLIDSALVTATDDDHRAHVLNFHHSHVHSENFGYRNMGPVGVLGRYGGEHFHHGEAMHGDGVEFSVVDNPDLPGQRAHVLHRTKGHKCNGTRAFNFVGHAILIGEDGLAEGCECIGNFVSTCHRFPRGKKLKLFRDTGGPQSETNAFTETCGSHGIWAHAGPAANPNTIHSNVTHGLGQAMVVFDRPDQDGDAFVIRNHLAFAQEGGPWGAMRNVTHDCKTFMCVDGAKIDTSGFSDSEKRRNKSVQLYRDSHITAIHHCTNDYTSGLKARMINNNLSGWVPTVFNAGAGVSRTYEGGKVHFDHLFRPIFQFSFAIAYIDIPDMTIEYHPSGWATGSVTLVYRTPMIRIIRCRGTYKGREIEPFEAYTALRIAEHLGYAPYTKITDQWCRLNFEPRQVGYLRLKSETMARWVALVPSVSRRWAIYPTGAEPGPFLERGEYYREDHHASVQDGDPHYGAGNGILPGIYDVKLQGTAEEPGELFEGVEIKPGEYTFI